MIAGHNFFLDHDYNYDNAILKNLITMITVTGAIKITL